MKNRDDYNEFNVTFEEFEKSMTQLKKEVKEMVRNNHSSKEIEEVINNGAKALITMKYRIKDANLKSGFGLHLIKRTLEICNDMAFGYLKEEILKQGE